MAGTSSKNAERRACAALQQKHTNRGSVTAELAVLLPVLTLLLALIVTGAQIGLMQLRVSEAAYAGARAAARGEPEAAAVIAQRTAGPAARATVNRDGGYVSVRVEASVDAGLAALLGGAVSATASARAESGGADSTWAEPHGVGT